MTCNDKRLIEDYLPIADISVESAREKNVRKGHISAMHLWWARRPLVACRAAVYASLVPASQFVPNGGNDAQKKSLGRANAAKFVKNLCQFPGSPHAINEAQDHILKAHAAWLSKDQGKTITVGDIVAGRAPRPRVLDMFAGGGAIPLEALRLGCDAYALDLNPVAHIVQTSTLVYPQKYGRPDPDARGMTGPKNAQGWTTWGGLANEVRHFGKWLLNKAQSELSDLYPQVADPTSKVQDNIAESQKVMAFAANPQQALERRTGCLTPFAYLWTRTVKCKNPMCAATVPLVKQTWLRKKAARSTALKIIAPKGTKQVRFEVVSANSQAGLGFDPSIGSEGGNATCHFCGTVADDQYVQEQGQAKRIGFQLMAVACTSPGARGKTYISGNVVAALLPDESAIEKRIQELSARTGLTVPDEPINPTRPSPNARGLTAVTRHGLHTFGDLFTSRQRLFLLTIACTIRQQPWAEQLQDAERAKAISTYMAGLLDKTADYGTSLCRWISQTEAVAGTFARHALPMLWDFAEISPFGDAGSNAYSILESQADAIESVSNITRAATVQRGSATAFPEGWRGFDAVITDPPYYDNVPYADVSDFFYVWQKRCIGHLYPEHFATVLTPKKTEATALASRHKGDMAAANREYESMMFEAFRQASQALRDGGQMIVVYAHKTTLGWATLVDALRRASFTVTEAWPLDTERGARLLAIDTASLASSIFLVARKREEATTGSYEEQVRTQLEEIVRERVDTLWDMGISGADLVIACVGAGLRAFTRFARVEYANGEEVPAERFLTEVETVVLETILARLSKEVGGKGGQYSLASLDTASRFYVLWRYTYGAAELDAGEAIIFANGTHVELDGQHGLTGGSDALVEKKKSKYRLRDYSERGENDKLGLLAENGQAAPLIDMLHRMLWLMEKRPGELAAFLTEARPNREQLRLVAQALAGPALKGGELGDISPTAELSALGKLTANWQSLIEDIALTTGEREEKKTGQKQLL